MDVTIGIAGYIRTDFTGINKLYDFYREASQYRNRNIIIDFTSMQFLDGNLCALFAGLLYKLTQERSLTFTTNHRFIKEKFEVLVRNGFITVGEAIPDVQKSTLHLMRFYANKLDDFVEYVGQDLMKHRGLNISPEKEYKIMDSIIEVATNIEIHADTKHPFFACGQFYPELKIFKFSMVDLGCGFLPAICKSTNGLISNDAQAIIWALERYNTTKLNEPGGLGLPDLYDYFSADNGHMQIISGNAFWSTELLNPMSYKKFNHECFGTTINLLFSYN